MAELVIKVNKIIDNIEKLNTYLEPKGIKWTLIVKILSGHIPTLKEILHHPSIKKVVSVGDSRLSSLKKIKEINPEIVTTYIKPPAMQHIKTVISYCDISHNTSISTLEALNKEAIRQKKIHKVIIMLEMGELREGVMRENLDSFYKKAFDLSNVKITGIGTNLGCMFGVEPTYDKLIQLSLYKQLLEAKFDRKIDFVSGGSSITLPVLEKKKVPPTINHFRIGESAFLGTDPHDQSKFRNLSTDTFDYVANIIELEKKDSAPDGILTNASIGQTSEQALNMEENTPSYKAVLDFGAIDVDVSELKPKNKKLKFIGTTSDMTVFDIGANLLSPKKRLYRVGSKVHFNPSYMAVARLMNSKFIDKSLRE